MRILITGVAGFIGSNLVERLLKDPNNQIVGLDNLSSGKLENLEEFKDNKNMQFIKHDICNEFDLDGFCADQIYHLACLASPKFYQAYPIETMNTCFKGTENVLKYAMKHGSRVVFSSTSEIYGQPLIEIQREDYFGNTNTIGKRAAYDESKRVAETLCMNYHWSHNVDVRIARIFNTYGKKMRCDDGRVISNFVCQALRGEDITVYTTSDHKRCFQYIDDLIDGLVALMNVCEYDHLPINLGNDEDQSTVMDIAREIHRLTSSRSEIVYTNTIVPDDPKTRKPDIMRARRILHWRPRWILEEGLKETIKYYKKVAL